MGPPRGRGEIVGAMVKAAAFLRTALAMSAAVQLGACAAGGGLSDASCAVISATGSCSLATVTPTPTTTPASVTMLTETVTTNYVGLGGSRQVDERVSATGVRTEEFFATTSPVTPSQISVVFEPTNATFRLRIQQPAGGVVADSVFDDPLFRTAFGNARSPQAGTPDLPNFTYLQRGPTPSIPDEVVTFFYENPGTRTRFVTLAGFVRNTAVVPTAITPGTAANQGLFTRERSAFVFGTPTPLSRVPTTGTASFTGGLLATAINNTELDSSPTIRSRTEWISGTATVAVNFAVNSINVTLSGNFMATSDAFEGSAGGLAAYNSSSAGRSFAATGIASFGSDRPAFSGNITSAAIGGRSLPVAVGILNGSLFGSRAEEIGGNFRIVGGGADQRVDIIGGFTGAR